MDIWRDEIKLPLNKSYLYTTLSSRVATNNPDVLSLIDRGVEYAVLRTKTVIRHMGEFTLHDSDHLFRVLRLMENLLTESNIDKLSTPELILLILAAFFHDIGMAPDEKDVVTWRKIWDANPILNDTEEIELYTQFKRFYLARPDQEVIINNLIQQGKNSEADIIKSYLITEYIRQTHAERARELIARDWGDQIKYQDTDLTVEFAQLCFSHNEDSSKLLDFDNNILCGYGETASLPLVGVILRLADILDFDAKRTPSILYSHLYVRNPISISEWNKHRSIQAWVINPDIIQYSAKCVHPVIESSIHSFCNIIDQELSACNNIKTALDNFNNNNTRDLNILFPLKVNRDKIETKRDIYNKPLYIFRETRFDLSKRQVIELLMGTKLYGNPQVALRELIQNSIDACLLRKAQEDHWGNSYTPEITVRYYYDGNNYNLEVIDNGTGMDQTIIDKYYSKVGSSFYKSADFYDLKSQSNADFTPTSRFGIGILSSFMVADTLIVDTRRVYGAHDSSAPLNVTVEGQDSIFWIKQGERSTPGTSTKLILRKSNNPWENLNDGQFVQSLESVIPNPPFRININTSTVNKTIDENTFKFYNALSLKDPSWNSNDNLKILEFQINELGLGIIGSAVVAILVSHNYPVSEVSLSNRNIELEGQTFTLNRKLTYNENAISSVSESITVNENGGINQYSSINNLATSKSKISLHGIEVPTTLFPQQWEIKNNQVRLSWPFPLIIVLDIGKNRDLDLNSPRTEIIMGEKWVDFEETLAYIICKEIKNCTTPDFWQPLEASLRQRTGNQQFIRGLDRVSAVIS